MKGGDTMENKITKFEGMYDVDMNRDLYLLVEASITEDQYNTIKTYVGVTFPDGQILKKGESYIIRGDRDINEVKADVGERVVAAGGENPFGA